MFGRYYTPDVRPEGTTASSKGFSQREQAEEGQYIRKRELEKLKQAEEKLKQAQADVVSCRFVSPFLYPGGKSFDPRDIG